jgi:hypothetical protein
VNDPPPMPVEPVNRGLYPPAWRDLPGEITVTTSDDHLDVFLRNTLTIIVKHRLAPNVTYAGLISCNREAWNDGSFVRMAIIDGLDRFVRPWLWPDRYAWPTIILWPSAGTNRRRLR